MRTLVLARSSLYSWEMEAERRLNKRSTDTIKSPCCPITVVTVYLQMNIIYSTRPVYSSDLSFYLLLDADLEMIRPDSVISLISSETERTNILGD